MSATREQAATALLALLETTANYVTVSRRNRDPEGMDPELTPALFLLDSGGNYRRPATNLPPVRTMFMTAVIYSDVGQDENAIPATIVNNALDALDAALKPDNFTTGAFTLGGRVESCMVEGDIESAFGDLTGKSLAIVPIRILLP